MAPKIKVTREEIIDAAVEVVRKKGVQAINARTVAAQMDCSTQPVFSNFATMDQLHLAVIERADKLFRESMEKEMRRGEFPPYKAIGMAYIWFAKEEKELFRLLYMRNRSGEPIPEESEINNTIKGIVRQNTGLSETAAKLFHLEMWAYVHGIATMFATGFLDLDWDLVSKMLTDSYQGLRKQYGME